MRYILYKTMKKIIINDEKKLFYKNLSEEENTIDLKNEDYIKKDIYRTFNKEKISEENIKKLENILINFTKIDKTIGYCQGMNFIVGFLLFITNGNEIDSFYLMIALLSKTYNKKYGIRGFFTNKFPLLQLYIWIFHLEFSKKFNKIYNLFLKLQIPDECWISKWFQTLFVHNIPYCNLVRLWDFIFTHGIKGLISICLSLIDYFEKDFEKVKDETDVTDIFKRIRKDSKFVDIKKIIELASKKYHIKKKHLSKYKKEYIIEKNIKTKTSVFDDIKYDMNIIKNYIIGSNLDFINNFEGQKFDVEIDFNEYSKKLNKCKKFSSNVKYNKNMDKDYDCIIRESKLEHNIPYSNHYSDDLKFHNPFSSISNK